MNSILNSLFLSNNPCFDLFSRQHIIILLVLGLIIFIMSKICDLLRNKKFNSLFRFSLITMLVSQQILNYLWYYINGQLTLIDALPLYPCRVSELLSIFLLIKWNRRIADVLFFVGISGAVLALILPDTGGLGFPNAMFIQFFLGHIGIILTVLFTSISQKYIPNKKSLIRCYKYTSLYILIVLVINQFLGSNYAYLRVPPPSITNILPSYPCHIPIIVGVMFILFGLMYIPCIYLNKKVIN